MISWLILVALLLAVMLGARLRLWWDIYEDDRMDDESIHYQKGE